MLRATLANNRVIGIAFSHKHKRTEFDSGHISYYHTVCDLFELTPDGGMAPLSVGISYCSEHDNFCKETGRKIALTNALWEVTPLMPDTLSSTELSKEERAGVWAAYFNRSEKR